MPVVAMGLGYRSELQSSHRSETSPFAHCSRSSSFWRLIGPGLVTFETERRERENKEFNLFEVKPSFSLLLNRNLKKTSLSQRFNQKKFKAFEFEVNRKLKSASS